MNTTFNRAQAACTNIVFSTYCRLIRPMTHLACVVILLLTFALPGQAQLGFTAGSKIVHPDETIEVPITVSNFDSIGGFQLSFAWDTAVVSFNTITNFNLDKIENFEFAVMGPGSLFLYWFAENVDAGYSVSDGDTIFSLEFTVTGNVGDSTWVSFVDEPNAPEAVDYDDNKLPLEFTFGLLVVDNPSSTTTIPSAAPLVMQIVPNPCREWCDVQLTVTEPMDVQVQIMDLSGQIVFNITRHLEPGQQEVSLQATEALANGGYFIIVQSERSRYIKKMVIQK
jgi:hypothetical protein